LTNKKNTEYIIKKLYFGCRGGRNERKYKNKKIYFIIFILSRMSYGKFVEQILLSVRPRSEATYVPEFMT